MAALWLRGKLVQQSDDVEVPRMCKDVQACLLNRAHNLQ